MSALELFTGPGETLSDRLKAAVQARTLGALVKEAQNHADQALADEVHRLSEQTGTAFTARGDNGISGWSAVLTAPQPKPHIVDDAAFRAWWAEAGLPHETVERVEVFDHGKATDLLRMLADRAGNRQELATLANDAMTVMDEVVLPEKPLEVLTADVRFEATGDGLVDTQTGELIPGVTCFRQQPQLQVRGDRQAKARERRELADRLGIPAELAEGDQ